MNEEAVLFGETSSLTGIVTEPLRPTPTQTSYAVILLNPGVVHRVGPGRIYVKIARALAENGFVALRFDFSGIGDSSVRQDNLQFEKSAVNEAQAAMDYLEATKGIQQFILLGGCSGATVSLDTACCDRRVAGALLINFPATATADGDADATAMNRTAAHYYLNFALFDPKSWIKLLTGKSNYQSLFRSLLFLVRRRFELRSKPVPKSSPLRAALRCAADRGVQVTFLSSQGDPGLDDLREAGGRELKQLLGGRKIAVETIPGADHTFSALQDQGRLLDAILKRAGAIRTAGTPAPLPVTCSAIKDLSLADADQRI